MSRSPSGLIQLDDDSFNRLMLYSLHYAAERRTSVVIAQVFSAVEQHLSDVSYVTLQLMLDVVRNRASDEFNKGRWEVMEFSIEEEMGKRKIPTGGSDEQAASTKTAQ